MNLLIIAAVASSTFFLAMAFDCAKQAIHTNHPHAKEVHWISAVMWLIFAAAAPICIYFASKSIVIEINWMK